MKLERTPILILLKRVNYEMLTQNCEMQTEKWSLGCIFILLRFKIVLTLSLNADRAKTTYKFFSFFSTESSDEDEDSGDEGRPEDDSDVSLFLFPIRCHF